MSLVVIGRICTCIRPCPAARDCDALQPAGPPAGQRHRWPAGAHRVWHAVIKVDLELRAICKLTCNSALYPVREAAAARLLAGLQHEAPAALVLTPSCVLPSQRLQLRQHMAASQM
jgi:hypothetical protein